MVSRSKKNKRKAQAKNQSEAPATEEEKMSTEGGAGNTGPPDQTPTLGTPGPGMASPDMEEQPPAFTGLRPMGKADYERKYQGMTPHQIAAMEAREAEYEWGDGGDSDDDYYGSGGGKMEGATSQPSNPNRGGGGKGPPEQPQILKDKKKAAAEGSSLQDFYAALIGANLNALFPEGCTTPEAYSVRAKRYMVEAGIVGPNDSVSGAEVMEFVSSVRSKREYQPKVGHRRAAMIHCMALLVAAVRENRSRPMTDRMNRMVDESFPPEHRRAFWKCLSGTTTEIEWKKDGKPTKFRVGNVGATEVQWAKAPWAPMRDEGAERKDEGRDDRVSYGGSGKGFGKSTQMGF